MGRVLLILVAFALLGSAGPAAAKPRSLRWRTLDVHAYLDDVGSLHVSERHAMVFTGAWNGGERVFRLGRGQRLAFGRLLRADAGGPLREVPPGRLDGVDRWAFADERTLRWRSRAPGDPEYDETEIVYVIEYVLSNVLVTAGEGSFRLDHDFAFPDRQWPIERLGARLEMDSSWKAEPGSPLSFDRRDLAPGQGAVASIALRRAGASSAVEVWTAGLPAPFRPALVAFFATVLAIATFVVVRHGRARGLFAPLPTVVDDAWLRAHVFAFPAEVVGAAWDRTISAPEVSAVLARMAAEGKIEGRVQSVRSRWLGRSRELHQLVLRVSRRELSGRERALVDAIFVAGDTIDSDRLREHYEEKGFDPADHVRYEIEAAVARLVPDGDPPPTWPLPLAAAFLAVGVVLTIAGALRSDDAAPVVGCALMGAFLLALTLGAAGLLGRTVVHVRRWLLALFAVLLAWAAWISWLAAGGMDLDPLAVAASAALWTSAAALAARFACPSTSAEGIAVRRRLAAARAYFARELRTPRPRLDDAWSPYLAAFGLGRQLDGWLRVHGAPGGDAVADHSPGGGGSRVGGAGGWTGGGGRFSGGGATGTWTALASVSSAISEASSSDGGGSGGGGSSGGGGGGGW